MTCGCHAKPTRRHATAPPGHGAVGRAPGSAALSNQSQLRRLQAAGGDAGRLAVGGVRIRADLAPAADVAPGPAGPPPTKQPEDAPVQQMGAAACPVTAVFLSTLAGPEKVGCQIPSGKYGASRLTRWRVAGDLPGGGTTATISEKFTAIQDPYNLIGAIQQGTSTTANGLFDDCYSLATDKPLPPDFILKVEQNHLLGGQVISKNEITYYPDRVAFCSHRRLSESCDFGARCAL